MAQQKNLIYTNKIMKKIILGLALLSMSISFSQNCKYKTNEVDEFTKNKILETEFEWISPNIGSSFKKVNEKKALRLQINSSSVFSVREGSNVMFLTDKEDPITLVFSETNISKISTLTSFYSINYLILSDENQARLLNEKITKIRIYYSDGYVDTDIKEKKVMKFKELLKCI